MTVSSIGIRPLLVVLADGRRALSRRWMIGLYGICGSGNRGGTTPLMIAIFWKRSSDSVCRFLADLLVRRALYGSHDRHSAWGGPRNRHRARRLRWSHRGRRVRGGMRWTPAKGERAISGSR